VIAGYVLGLPYGASGVALGYSVMMVLLTVPMILWTVHGTPIARRDIVSALTPTFVSAIVAGIAGFGAGYVMRGAVPVARLVVEGGVLVVVYLLMLLFAMGQKAFYVALAKDSKFAVLSR
jgi:PST family polysaccharide transporter